MNSTSLGSGTRAQAVIAVLEAKPNCAGELAALVRRLTPHVRAEPGCLGFIPYRAQTNAGRIYIYEVYADAFDAHLQQITSASSSPHFRPSPPTADENPPCNSTSLTEPPRDRHLTYGRSLDVRGIEGTMWPQSWMR